MKFKKNFFIATTLLTIVFSVTVNAATNLAFNRIAVPSSSNILGYVSGYNDVGGNGTTGYYANSWTSLESRSNCSGVAITSNIKLISTTNGSVLKNKTVSNNGSSTYGQTVQVNAYSGTVSNKNFKAVSTHSLSGTISFSRSMTTYLP